jgi:hypothetical protein
LQSVATAERDAAAAGKTPGQFFPVTGETGGMEHQMEEPRLADFVTGGGEDFSRIFS